MKVEGIIEFIGPPGTFPGGLVHVFVEDASRSDAAAVVVAQQAVKCNFGVASCQFSVEAGKLVPSQYYLLRVHVDVDGDGAISPGDYVTTGSYRVPGQTGTMRVQVFPVR